MIRLSVSQLSDFISDFGISLHMHRSVCSHPPGEVGEAWRYLYLVHLSILIYIHGVLFARSGALKRCSQQSREPCYVVTLVACNLALVWSPYSPPALVLWSKANKPVMYFPVPYVPWVVR